MRDWMNRWNPNLGRMNPSWEQMRDWNHFQATKMAAAVRNSEMRNPNLGMRNPNLETMNLNLDLRNPSWEPRKVRMVPSWEPRKGSNHSPVTMDPGAGAEEEEMVVVVYWHRFLRRCWQTMVRSL